MNSTELDYEDYVESLSLTEWPEEVRALDGAVLYRVNDEHFAILGCLDHVHKGPILLRRVMPKGWIKFAEEQNTDDGFRAEHWGASVIDVLVGFLFAGPLILIMWAGAARAAWWLWTGKL